METELLLDDMEQNLYDIHALLFGGNITNEDLSEIREILKDYFYILKKIKKHNEEVYRIVDRIIKLFRIFFSTSSLLMICFIILNILSFPVGIGLFIFFNYLSYSIKNAYKKVKEDDKIDIKVEKLISDVKYKEDITEKKLQRLNKLAELQVNNSKIIEFSTINAEKNKLPRILELKPKYRQ